MEKRCVALRDSKANKAEKRNPELSTARSGSTTAGTMVLLRGGGRKGRVEVAYREPQFRKASSGWTCAGIKIILKWDFQ